MSASVTEPRYSVGEEIANSVIHGVGVVLAIIGLTVLASFATLHGSARHVIGCSVFGATLILLYTASTLYHSIPLTRAKAVLRVLDHSAIYLLIAGTYTPFALLSLRGPSGGWLLVGIWSAALVGIVLRAGFSRVPRVVFLGLYVVMGWAVLVVIEPMVSALPARALWTLVLGGLFYTGGIVFYLWRELPYHHAIWHGFVLVGSVLHFFAVLFVILAPAAEGHP